MPPVLNVTCQPISLSTEELRNKEKDDINALLYIVVTLLFYSMGIIIGIITYLKREQAEMEEDKLFEMYLQLKGEPCNMQKKERVQQMALHLKRLEEQQQAREKIENWKTSDPKHMLPPYYHHHEPCRRHYYQHSPCQDCMNTIHEVAGNYPDESRIDVSNSDLAEKGDSTALLCSLTLGVCEPLLTHDVLKRVTFPCSLPTENINPHGSVRSPSVSTFRKCGRNGGPFKHSSLAVHTSAVVSKDGVTNELQGNETKVLFLDRLQRPLKGEYVPSMFEKGDIELMELPEHESRSAFHKNPMSEGNMNVCSRTPPDVPIMSTFDKQNKPLAKYSTPSMQSCRKPEEKLYNLTGHNSPEANASVSVDLHCENVIPLVDTVKDKEALIEVSQPQRRTTNEEGAALKYLHPSHKTADDESEDVLTQQSVHTQQTDSIVTEEHRYLNESHLETLPAQLTSPTSTQLSQDTYPVFKHHLSLLPISLPQQHQQQQQQIHPDETRAKTSPSSNILRSLDDDDKGSSEDGANFLQHRQNKSNHPWKKSNSQNFDIPDCSETYKAGLEGKNKIVDKKNVTRTQPDRRGALFFTQRSLQKELDSPKSSTSQKPSTSAVIFDRPENEGLQSSRTSETTEENDSPILRSFSDIGSDLTLPNTSSSSSPPPTSDKQKGRIPRLVKSQTIDPTRITQK